MDAPAGLPVGDVDAGCVRQDAHVPVLGAGRPGLVPHLALLDQAPLQSRPDGTEIQGVH